MQFVFASPHSDNFMTLRCKMTHAFNRCMYHCMQCGRAQRTEHASANKHEWHRVWFLLHISTCWFSSVHHCISRFAREWNDNAACVLCNVMSLTDPLWNGMVAWWHFRLLDWMSQIKRFLFLFAHFFPFMIRASPSKSSGLSFSFSITLKTLPSPCRCTTLLAVPLDKVNALGFTNTSI